MFLSIPTGDFFRTLALPSQSTPCSYRPKGQGAFSKYMGSLVLSSEHRWKKESQEISRCRENRMGGAVVLSCSNQKLGGKQIQNSAFWFKHCSQIGYTDMLQTHSQHKVILSFNRIYRSAILSCFQSWNLEVHFEAQMLGKTYLITLAQER